MEKNYYHENYFLLVSKQTSKYASKEDSKQTNKQTNKQRYCFNVHQSKGFPFLLLIGIRFIEIDRFGKYLKTVVSIRSNFRKVYDDKVLTDTSCT